MPEVTFNFPGLPKVSQPAPFDYSNRESFPYYFPTGQNLVSSYVQRLSGVIDPPDEGYFHVFTGGGLSGSLEIALVIERGGERFWVFQEDSGSNDLSKMWPCPTLLYSPQIPVGIPGDGAIAESWWRDQFGNYNYPEFEGFRWFLDNLCFGNTVTLPSLFTAKPEYYNRLEKVSPVKWEFETGNIQFTGNYRNCLPSYILCGEAFVQISSFIDVRIDSNDSFDPFFNWIARLTLNSAYMTYIPNGDTVGNRIPCPKYEPPPGPPPARNLGSSFNYLDSSRRYHRVNSSESNIIYRRSSFAVPESWKVEKFIGAGESPKLTVDSENERVRVVYHRIEEKEEPTDPDVFACYERFSDDDGVTWVEEMKLFDGCKRPTLYQWEGAILRAAFCPLLNEEDEPLEYGTIKAKYQAPGEEEPGGEFVCKFLDGGNLSDLVVKDDNFHFVFGGDVSDLWVLVCNQHDPDNGIVELYSSDNGETWRLVQTD